MARFTTSLFLSRCGDRRHTIHCTALSVACHAMATNAAASPGRRRTLPGQGTLLLVAVVAALGANLRMLVNETQSPRPRDHEHGWLPVAAVAERRSAGDHGGPPAYGKNSSTLITNHNDKNGLLVPPALEVPSQPTRTANGTRLASQAQVTRSLDLNSSATKDGNTYSDASVAAVSAEIRTNSMATMTASEPAPLQGTAVIQLYGELGNHLQILAHYFAVQVIALEEFNLNLTLHVRKQKARKAKSAAENAMCIKSFEHVDFDECSWEVNTTNGHGVSISKGEYCQSKLNDQMASLHGLHARTNFTHKHFFSYIQSLQLEQYKDSESIRTLLRRYVDMCRDPVIQQLYRDQSVGWSENEPHPFLVSIDRIHATQQLIDEVYSRGMPGYFAFDDETKISSGCCASLPEPDEHVFHYRSFVVDLPKTHIGWGGAELVPAKAAELLSQSVPPGSRVALVAGRAAPHRVQAYKEAFHNRSLVVRAVSGQSAIQDFCFLAHAQAGLWGTVQSSYVNWASLISTKLQHATLYGVNYPARKKNVTGRTSSNMEMRQLIHWPVFHVPDDEVW